MPGQIWSVYHVCLLSSQAITVDWEDGEDEGVECHKLVLSAVSPYFRAMFRNQDSKDIKLHGVQSETLRSLVNYCYTGGSRLAD